MANTGNKVYNLFINSANRAKSENAYNFSIYFDNEDILVNANEGMNVNVVSFSMLNSMYNVNKYTNNNTFNLVKGDGTEIPIIIPYGNYNVYSFLEKLNLLLNNYMSVAYDVATNTYTYTRTAVESYSIKPLNCKKLLGIFATTPITTTGTQSGYVNMVNYQQIILKCPTLVYETLSMDNIQDENNNVSISDILFWFNKQDIEPFKMINYRNEDCSTLYSYNVFNTRLSMLTFKLVNEYDEPILDAPDFLLQLQISVFDKDNNYFKEASLQMLKIVNDIYFLLLNLLSIFGVFRPKKIK
jgi:hypothetical protein